MYHFADMPGEISLELSWEDIHKIIKEIGFEILVSQKTKKLLWFHNKIIIFELPFFPLSGRDNQLSIILYSASRVHDPTLL